MYQIDRPGAVAASLPAPTKKSLFAALAQMAERAHGIPHEEVLERLVERERLGSTGFGGGTAIPHGRIDRLTEIVAVFVRLPLPLDFDSVDGLPVDLVFMLLSPTDAGARHLQALASVSRLLRDRAFLAKVRDAANEDALVALFSTDADRDAA